MHQRPTIFLIDNDEATCQAMRELAGTMNLACDVYSSGQAFLDSLDASRPGCLVMELNLPGIDGLQLQSRLNQMGIGLPMVFLAARTDVPMAVEAMRMGAVHFLQKPFRAHEVWMAVQEAIELDRHRRRMREEQKQFDQCLARLTARQRHVLALLGQGKSSHEIAEVLRVTDRTVELHRAHLMRSLRVASARELVDLAILVHHGNLLNADAGRTDRLRLKAAHEIRESMTSTAPNRSYDSHVDQR